jgi:hypothetical protein
VAWNFLVLFTASPFTAALPAMRAVATEPEIAMHAVVDTLHTYFDKLLNSPHHLMAYIAAAAVLLVSIPLARALFGSHSRSDRDIADDAPVSAASPSMLGLSSPVIDFKPVPIERAPSRAQSPIPSNVTAINGSLTVECIHCGVTMPSRQDFCPACGYAQPMKQSFTAAFPA